MLPWVLLALVALESATAEFYETYSAQQVSPFKYAQYRAQGLEPYCVQDIKTCDEKEPRRFDYSCNNLHYPVRGTQMTPFRRMLPPVFGRNFDHRPSSSGTPLPNVRAIRTSIMPDGRATSPEFTYLLANALLIVAGDVTTVHDTFNYIGSTITCCITGESDPRCRPIYIPNEDLHLRYSNIRCLNLTRVITYQDLGCVQSSLPPERVSTAPPMLDLSIVYGISEQRMRRGREFRGGRLRVESLNGNDWPPAGGLVCVGNQIPVESRCHDVPNPGMNSLVGTNVMGIWLYRNHNRLARQLETLNPCWDDDRIFREAREINIALFYQIIYHELLPSLMGRKYLLEEGVIHDTLDHVNDYDHKLEPRVSIEFVIALRWFHSMQDGRLKKYNRKGKLLDELKIVDMTLRTGLLPNNNTIEGITQAFFRQPTAQSDNIVDPEMGERVLGGFQTAADIMSSDMMKGREAALPPYVEYRKFCHLLVPKDFDDLLGWMLKEEVEALSLNYERVEDIDLYAGFMAEKPVPGGTLGPTLMCVLADQFRYSRKADRFWYENDVHPGAFNKEQLNEIRGMTMARLICDNGDDVDAIQPHAFILPGPHNKITNCKNIPTINLEPWKDQCGSNHDTMTHDRQTWSNNPSSRNTGLGQDHVAKTPNHQSWSLNAGSRNIGQERFRDIVNNDRGVGNEGFDSIGYLWSSK